MNEYIFLISLAIILLTTKILGDVTNKVNMTQVVGALLAGVLIGPSCLDWVTETDFVEKAAEIGVILLMFTAGLDTDVKQLKKNSVACIVIASIGVLVPHTISILKQARMTTKKFSRQSLSVWY